MSSNSLPSKFRLYFNELDKDITFKFRIINLTYNIFMFINSPNTKIFLTVSSAL